MNLDNLYWLVSGRGYFSNQDKLGNKDKVVRDHLSATSAMEFIGKPTILCFSLKHRPTGEGNGK